MPAGDYPDGIAYASNTGKLYVSYFLTAKIGYQPGGLLCMDLNTNQLLWRKDYPQTVVPAPGADTISS